MKGDAIRRLRFLGVLAIFAALPVFGALPLRPARAADPQPQIVYQNLHNGDVLNQTVFGIQFCFATPVNIKDLDKGGDFAFTVTEPDGIGLGNRDVFQRDGYGITVYPGPPVGGTTGQWKYTYRLTSPDGQSALVGEIDYTVDPTGSPFPQATPPVCSPSGGTATASPTPGANATTPPVVITASPAATAQPTASPTAIATLVPGTSDNGPDILKYALLTIGAAGAAAIVLIGGFLLRKRVGFDPHRPKSNGDDTGHH